MQQTTAADDPQVSAITGTWADCSSPPTTSYPLGLALGGPTLSEVDLLQRSFWFLDSTDKIPILKKVFKEWCSGNPTMSFTCSILVLLIYFQKLLDKKKAFYMVKVDLVANSPCEARFGNMPVEQHPLPVVVWRVLTGCNQCPNEPPLCRTSQLFWMGYHRHLF